MLTPKHASAQTELLLGQNHYYSVVLRGNGEAIIYAKLVINNPEEKPLTGLSFEVPSGKAMEMVIFQQTLSQECVRYDYGSSSQKCMEYRDPDYNNYYYQSYHGAKAEYRKINFAQTGNLYQITLPYPVQPYKQTALIISYSVRGYVQKTLGLYKFNFETLKVPTRIQQAKVAVDVDSDLLLKGKKGQVTYSQDFTKSSTLEAGLAADTSSRSMDRIVSSIGSSGPIIKVAKNLSPEETFIVKGEYAKTWFRLYLRSIATTILFLGVILAGIHFVPRYWRKRKFPWFGKFTAQMPVQKIKKEDIVQQGQPPLGRVSSKLFSATHAGVGLLSVILVIGITLVIKFIANNLPFYPDELTAIVLVIIIGLMYILAVFGPAILLATKHGWKALLVTLMAEVAWLMILAILYIVLFANKTNRSSSSPRYYPYDDVAY